MKSKLNEILRLYDQAELRAALQEILSFSDILNKYFQDKERWKTKNKGVMLNCLNLVKVLGLIIQPYLPQTSEKILGFLYCKEKGWKKLHDFNIRKIRRVYLNRFNFIVVFY